MLLVAQFGQAFDAAVDALTAVAGIDDLAPLQLWRRLAHQAGPTTLAGPLTHDLLVPRRGLGLNVFSHSFEVRSTARAWTREVLGANAADVLAEWESGLSDDAEIHAGCLLRDGRWRLKLWLSDAATGRASGVDLTETGLERQREYRRDPVKVTEPGQSHRIIVELPGEKTSFDTIYRTDARLEDLPEDARCDVLHNAAERVSLFGFVLRPAAYELDVFDDGRREIDVLVTVGEHA